MAEIFQTTGIDTYLRDESGQNGQADAIAFPGTMEEAQEAIVAAKGRPVVFQGARTGLCGGAVPQEGLIINFTRMTGIRDFSYDPETETGTITLEAGVTLEQLRLILKKKQVDTNLFDRKALKNWAMYQQIKEQLMFLPNPSETTATIGGIAATDATGSRGSGKADPFLELALLLPGGQEQRIKPGAESPLGVCKVENAQNCAFSLSFAPKRNIGLLKGSEGLFGAITELKIALRKKPTEEYGLLAYFTDCSQIPAFLQGMEASLGDIPGTELLAADFFDESCAVFAKITASLLPELGRYPVFPQGAAAVLWMELGGAGDVMFDALEAAMFNLEKCSTLADKTLAATESRDFERLGRLRHLLTEAFNLSDTGALPILIDLTISEREWPKAVNLITTEIGEQLPGFTLMGHAGDGRLSLRLPGRAAETQKLVEYLTARFADAGYRCSREHGVGRIKKNLFRTLCPEEAALLRRLKKQADPDGNINPGVLVDLAE